MARKERIEVEAEFRPKGLGELKAKWADFAGDLLEPMVLLAAGASKAQAAWAGMRGVFESRVLGPLGLVAGASIGFLATTKLLIGKWRELGMTAAGALERMTLQFRPLLGSLDRAKERVMELQDFAVKTPFEIEEIVEANKMLETLTQGALANEKGMTLVGDAASVAGQAFSDVARMAGRLYDGLMSGRPVGEATMRLQEMGIISGTVRNQIESMQAANASGLEIWKVVEKQLEKNTGAMDAQSKSLEGLQSTYNDTKNAMEGGFSSGFLEGEKSGVAASIKLMEAMTPVLRTLGEELGTVDNAWEKFKLGAVEAATKGKTFGNVVEWGAKIVTGLAAVMAGAASASILAFTVRMIGLAVGSKKAAEAMQFEAAVAGSSVAAKTKLRAILGSLATAYRASAAGLKAEAAGHLSSAAAQTKNLVSTNGLVAAVKVGRGAFFAMGAAVRFVGLQLKLMAVAMVTNPLVLMAAAVMAIVSVLSKMAANTRKAKEELDGYQKATAAVGSGLQKQISEIRTLVDLRQAEAKILSELATAYKALDAAAPGPMKEAAQKRVDLVTEQLKNLPSTRDLEKSPQEVARERAERDGQKQVREFGREAVAAKGPEDALRVADDRLEEANRLRREALDLTNEEAAIEARSAAARQAKIENEAQLLRLVEQRAKEEQAIQQWTARLGEKNVWTEEKNNIREWLPGAQQELEKLDAKIRELGDAPENARLGELLASPSELQQIKAKIEQVDNLKAAVAAMDEAQKAVDQNTDEKEAGKLQDQLREAQEKAAQERRLAEKAGVADTTPEQRRAMTERRDTLEEKRTEDLDPMTAVRAAKERKDAELAVAQARLDAEAAVAALRMKGYEREVSLLDIERQKLEARKAADAIGEKEYARQSALLEERGRALAREGNERRAELAGALEIAGLRRRENEARLAGDPEREKAMRAAADAREDARTRKDAEREAQEAAATPEERQNYVDVKVKESQDARAAARKREEEERAAGRDQAFANQGSAVAAIEAEALRRKGKTKEARGVEEKAAREQDELDRKEAAKGYREQDFNAEAAETMANRDVRLAQGQRLMEQMNQGGGSIVASSLAKIGGGGNVAGTDPNTKYYERMVKLLEEIKNDGKKTVTFEMEP